MTDKHIEKTHDRFFKQMMSDKRVAREFFESHLPSGLLSVANLEKLELQLTSFIDDQLKESVADMLYKTEIEDHEAYFYLVVDHQSWPDKLMPFRILRYIYNIISKHLHENKGDKIPLVYPLVVYHGEKPWTYSTDINSLVDAPKHLIDAHFLKPFTLIDLNRIEDDQLKQKIWTGTMELTLKYIFAKDIQPVLKDIFALLKQVEQSDGKQFAGVVLTYILNRSELVNNESFFSSVRSELSSETGETVMTIADQLRAEGMEKGMEKGMEMRTIEVVKNMLSEHMDPAFIKKITGLPLAKILDLKDEAFA